MGETWVGKEMKAKFLWLEMCILLLVGWTSELDAQKVKLNWDLLGIDGIKGYRIYRKIDPTGDLKLIGEIAHPATVHFDKQLFINTKVQYAVTSLDVAGNESSFSQLADLFLPESVAPFGEFEIVVSNGDVKLTWQIREINRDWQFEIWRSDEQQNFRKIAVVNYEPDSKNDQLCFVDRNLASGYYGYQIVVTNEFGSQFFSEVKLAPVEFPQGFYLGQNYPNPFNEITSINYRLGQAGEVSLIVFNIAGEIVNQLVKTFQAAGNYQVKWSGVNENSNQLAAGQYYLRLKAGNFEQTKKMIILK